MIAELREKVGELEATVARLERTVSRNSGNSSMPPSTDDLPGGKPPSRQQRRAAQRAAMCWAESDEVIDHYLAGARGCGRDLAGAGDLGVARSSQQLEVPLMTARRVQHDLHQARCDCGKVHVAARPQGVPDAAVTMGPTLRALVVYLLVFQHVIAPAADACFRAWPGSGTGTGWPWQIWRLDSYDHRYPSRRPAR